MPLDCGLLEKCLLDSGLLKNAIWTVISALKNAIWTVISARVIMVLIVYICTYCLFLPDECIREIVDSMSLVAKL